MNKLKVFDGSLLYLLLGLTFVGVSLLISTTTLTFEAQILITQYLIIALPPVLYLKWKKIDVLEALRVRRLSFRDGLYILFITLLMYPVAVVLNTFVMLILSLLGTLNIPQVPTPTETGQYFLYLFIIAITAGICEEVLFRGFLMRSFEGVSYRFSILLTAVLFGIFHFNVYNLGATIFFGVVFGYLVVVTDSLWAGILGHIFNNAFAVSLGFAANRLSEMSLDWIEDLNGLPETGAAEVVRTSEIMIALLFFGFISLGTGFVGLMLLKRFRKPESHQARHDKIFAEQPVSDEDTAVREQSTLKKDLWPIYPVIGMFVVFAGFQLYEIIQAGM